MSGCLPSARDPVCCERFVTHWLQAQDPGLTEGSETPLPFCPAVKQRSPESHIYRHCVQKSNNLLPFSHTLLT